MESDTNKSKSFQWHRLSPIFWARECYNWALKWAEHKYGVYCLCFLAAIEAIFFPVPVDPFLLAMGAAKPKKSLWYAGFATLFSVGGGVIGFLIGLYFWENISEFFFSFIISAEKFNIVMEKFKDNAFLVMFVAAFTPIPFKVFTLTAGVAQINFPLFLLGSLVGRSIRFFIIGALLYRHGPPIRNFIEKHFDRITIGLTILLLLALFLL